LISDGCGYNQIDAAWNEIAAGIAGGDADGDGDKDPWILVQSREAFQALASGETPERVFGIARIFLFYTRSRARRNPPKEPSIVASGTA
jgi:hypothetical protein